MTMADNIKFSKHKEVAGVGYQRYDNYDAIEVPFIDAIPSDYDGVMGVPITFLDRYNPDQFEIIAQQRRHDADGGHWGRTARRRVADYCAARRYGSIAPGTEARY